MSAWNVVAPQSVVPTPWRNGGGFTRELLAWPHADDWRVRVSIAEVTRDGPFSPYPGVRRWFAVLSGGGVLLNMGAEQHIVTARSAPLEFDGGVPVDCRLIDGPTSDFNLMSRSSGAVMRRVQQGERVIGQAGGLVALYSPGRFAWRILNSLESIEVTTPHTLWMEIAP